MIQRAKAKTRYVNKAEESYKGQKVYSGTAKKPLWGMQQLPRLYVSACIPMKFRAASAGFSGSLLSKYTLVGTPKTFCLVLLKYFSMLFLLSVTFAILLLLAETALFDACNNFGIYYMT